MSPRQRFVAAAGLAALAAGLAAGCAKRERAAGKPLRVAVVPQGSTHEFWKSIHAGAVKAARDAQAGGTGGGIVGLINGLTITLLRIVPFIATLGMLGVARGAAKYFAGEQTINARPTWLNELAVTFPSRPWMLVAPGVWVAVVLAAAMTLVLRNTVFGRRVFAVGSNEAAARACGIATGRLKVWIYAVAGLFFGLAGVMQMSRLRQGDPTVAVGAELDVIAAVVIGGASLGGGEGSIPGAMIGALIMALLRNGCQQMGWSNYIQEIIIGVIIVLAVAADRYRAARLSRC